MPFVCLCSRATRVVRRLFDLSVSGQMRRALLAKARTNTAGAMAHNPSPGASKTDIAHQLGTDSFWYINLMVENTARKFMCDYEGAFMSVESSAPADDQSAIASQSEQDGHERDASATHEIKSPEEKRSAKFLPENELLVVAADMVEKYPALLALAGGIRVPSKLSEGAQEAPSGMRVSQAKAIADVCHLVYNNIKTSEILAETDGDNESDDDDIPDLL